MIFALPVYYRIESSRIASLIFNWITSITTLISNLINSIANARGLEELHFIQETRKNCRYEKMANICILRTVFSIYSWTFTCKPFLQSSATLHSCLIQEVSKEEKLFWKSASLRRATRETALDSITLFLFMSQTRSRSGEWALGTTPVGLKEGHGAYHWLSVFLDALASLDFKLSVSQWVIEIFLQLAHLRVFQIIFFCNWILHIYETDFTLQKYHF